MQTKICNCCKSEKDSSLFGKNKSNKDGLHSQCKECRKAYSALHSERNKISSKKWHAENKQKHADARKKKRLATLDLEVERLKTRTWRAKNPDKLRDQNRRLKLRRRNIPGSFYTEVDVINRYGTLCHICSIEIDFSAPRSVGKAGWEMALHLDHVIPISKGGRNDLDNVKPSHARCNLLKGAKQ